MTEPTSDIETGADRAQRFASALLCATGVPVATADSVAAALIEADQEGKTSHGLLQLPNYLRRLRAGTIDPAGRLEVLESGPCHAICDAQLMLGHAGAEQAMALATGLAQEVGLGLVAVRRATHFGVGGRYARQATDADCIGFAFSNTRPMIPAPGGAKALVGNNPLAIAVPAEGGAIVLDMAMSATSMGKIRAAAARNEPIAPGLAVDTAGVPTTNAQSALAGLLLPAGGAKGFGLALIVDLLCGLLSGGKMGDEIASMFGAPETPAECAWLFLAISLSHFGNLPELRARAEGYASGLEASGLAAGGGAPHVPGRGRTERIAGMNGNVHIPAATLAKLRASAEVLGLREEDRL